MDHAPEKRRRFSKKYINLPITPKLFPLGVEEAMKFYIFLSPYPTDATFQIWSRLAQ